MIEQESFKERREAEFWKQLRQQKLKALSFHLLSWVLSKSFSCFSRKTSFLHRVRQTDGSQGSPSFRENDFSGKWNREILHPPHTLLLLCVTLLS